MVKRKGVCVLLGAGASYDAGLPTSKGILTEFIKHIEPRQDDGTPYWCRSGEPWWRADIPEVEHTIRLIKSTNVTDIEHLMRELEARSSSHGPLSEESFEYGKMYRSALGFIYWRLRTPRPELVEYYNHLSHLRYFNGERPLTVATLNWDCCVERALGWRNVSTGFDTQNSKIWTHGTFNLSRSVWLIKLHGSLSWVDYSWRDAESGLPNTEITFNAINETTGSPFNKITEVSLWDHEAKWGAARVQMLRPVRSPIPWPRLIVFGSEIKKTHERALAIFPVLRQRFIETLRVTKVLISIGFSWRDAWVCRLVREAENDGLSVIDIHPAAKRSRPWHTPSGRIRVPCSASAALENLETLLFPLVKQCIV